MELLNKNKEDTRFDFCRLELGKDDNIATVYREDGVVAFMDADPAVDKGHVLVVPVKHYSLITDMPPEEVAQLALVVQKIAAAVKRTYNTDSVKIEVFDGKGSGGTVNHLHIHVIPRYENDEFEPGSGKPVYWKTYSERHNGAKPSLDQLRATAKKIAENMPK
jgi:histidine triad (HIT) family protein